MLQCKPQHNTSQSSFPSTTLLFRSKAINMTQNQTRSQNPNTQAQGDRIVICIGDIHGYITKLETLWSNLKSNTNPLQFDTAIVIFLGDYCDRGPDTKKVLDFLISLPSKFPNQSHVFLCGNHDLAFAAFLEVLQAPKGDGSWWFRETWREYEQSEDRERWYVGDGFEDMHLQGRRWGGSIRVKFNTAMGTEYKGSIYDAAPTFESYGVPHGSAAMMGASWFDA